MPSPDLSFELRTAQDGDYDFAERLYLATNDNIQILAA